MSSWVKPPLGALPLFGHPLAEGLVGYWLMNEGGGSIVRDLSGNPHNGTRVGTGNVWVGGKFGPATEFNGDDDYFDVGGEVSLDNDGTKPMSWVGWVYKRAGDSNWCAKQDADDTPNQPGWGLFSTAAHKFGLQIRNRTLNRVLIIDNDAMNLNQWYFLVATYDGSKTLAGTNIYKNGVLITSFSATADTLSDSSSNAIVTRISGRGDNTTEWNGFIDNVMIWNRVLTPTEVAQLFLEPFAMFVREPIELWVGSVGAGAPPVGLDIPIAAHHYKMLRAS